MGSKRRFLAPFTLIFLAGVTLAEATLTPPQFFTSLLYWLGLLVFGVLGAFGLGNKSQRVQKYSAMAFSFVLISAAGAGRRFPDATTFAFGFPGLFVGIGLRILYWFTVRQKWAYCPTCQVEGWAYKKEAGWVCDKGHGLQIGH